MYYIYAYIRQDGTPYYIGKGKNNRAWNKHYNIKRPKNEKQIVIMESNLTEIGALALERFYIRWYGRKDNGTGILRNMTDGGEGVHNRVGWKHSEETKNKIKESNIGKIRSAESNLKQSKSMKNKNLGMKKSQEMKEKLSKSLKGRKKSEEWVKKINNNPEKIRKTAEKHRGMKRSAEAREKMSKAAKGRIPWNKGIKINEYYNRPGI